MANYLLRIRYVDFWLFQKTGELLPNCDYEDGVPNDLGGKRVRAEPYRERAFRFTSESDQEAIEASTTLVNAMDVAGAERRYALRYANLCGEQEVPETKKRELIRSVWDYDLFDKVPKINTDQMASFGGEAIPFI